MQIPTQPRILITRLSAIGDCIHTVPLVTAIRKHYPRAHIAWATQGGPASLIQGIPGLDHVYQIERSWLRNLRSISHVRKLLRAGKFDVAIDPQSLTKSSLLGWLSGAKYRIGFTKGQAREASPWLNNHRVAPNTRHVVDRYLELLKPLGIVHPNVEFHIPAYASEAATMRSFLNTHGLSGFALLNPGAGWESKRWPTERYATVANHLMRQHQLRSVVLWSGDRELEMAETILAGAPEATVLAPSTTLPELAELCRASRLFVGSDTGPMHLAAAVAIPCVAMYGPTEPEVCGPYGSAHESIQAYLQSGSSSERRGEDNSAMQAITTEMVTAACDRVIARASRQAS